MSRAFSSLEVFSELIRHLPRRNVRVVGTNTLRAAHNGACAALCSGGEQAPALKLADGFGIPEHLIAAPIATGATSAVLLPMKAPGPIVVRCLPNPS